jgi:23S rRNA (cytidine2498-2'-O)-methyltransferase
MPLTTIAPAIVALCRAGFEPETTRDLEVVANAAALAHLPGDSAVPGIVFLPLRKPPVVGNLSSALAGHPPIFAREIFVGRGPYILGERDRVTPIVAAVREAGHAANFMAGSAWLEHPDTNDGKELSPLCRRLAPLLQDALRAAQLLTSEENSRLPRLHILFLSKERAFVATSAPGWNSEWPMGIPRLRMPREVPSRSTLKLAEAFGTFLSTDQQLRLLRPGLRAVDLGAAPGGWTWQLSQRGLRVTAVDNGPLKGSVADDSLVTHVRADGLKWRPPRPVDWLVCDIVEQPIRIAELVGRWIADGTARRAIFNLKLPMKKRYDEVQRCTLRMLEITERANVDVALKMRQLYHDREEVTGYLARVD